jgi:hypothetical protein
MSVVTTILLHPGTLNADEVETAILNTPVPAHSPHAQYLRPLSDSSDHWGGHAGPPVLWGGSFKSLDWDAFAAWIEGLPWRYPHTVEVLVLGEWSDTFTAWRINQMVGIDPQGGRLQRVLDENRQRGMVVPG